MSRKLSVMSTFSEKIAAAGVKHTVGFNTAIKHKIGKALKSGPVSEAWKVVSVGGRSDSGKTNWTLPSEAEFKGEPEFDRGTFQFSLTKSGRLPVYKDGGKSLEVRVPVSNPGDCGISAVSYSVPVTEFKDSFLAGIVKAMKKEEKFSSFLTKTGLHRIGASAPDTVEADGGAAETAEEVVKTTAAAAALPTHA